jgi:isochorismate synthase
MIDGLIYRFPGEPTQAFTGNWSKLNFSDLTAVNDAFVASNAEGTEVIVFQQEMMCRPEDFPFEFVNHTAQKGVAQDQYVELVENLRTEMIQNDIPKVVFSRVEQMNTDRNLLEVFHDLENAYPQTLVYYLQSREWGCWLGASPEILLQQVGEEAYKTMALAGTLPVDVATAKWTEKEIKEQEYVVEYITDVIEAFGSMIDVTARKEVVAGPVKHLRTDFILHLSAYNLPSFLQRLHPTPAVCGVPKELAEACYKKHERHERRLYTGFIGRWSKEKLHLFVNLRCMQCFGNEVNLFVGGGITQDSYPLHEWEETEKKAQTLKQFLV